MRLLRYCSPGWCTCRNQRSSTTRRVNQRLTAVIFLRFRHDGRRDQTGLDRRPYPFAAFRIGQPGCITDEQHPVIQQLAPGMPVQKIGMAMELVGDVPGNSAALPEEIAEILELLRKTLVALPAQPDIEVVAFAEAPAVSLEIPAEIKFRRIRADPAGQPGSFG